MTRSLTTLLLLGGLVACSNQATTPTPTVTVTVDNQTACRTALEADLLADHYDDLGLPIAYSEPPCSTIDTATRVELLIDAQDNTDWGTK